MSSQTAVQSITEQDLLRYGAQGQPVEVVNGEIVAVTGVGVRHSMIAANLYRILYAFVMQSGLGLVFTDGLIYVLKRNPDGSIRKSRIPDASFVRRERIPADFDLSKAFPGAPDLAVEVVSPTEATTDTADKINDYLAEGTEQVWVFYPDQKEMHQYRRGSDTIRVYKSQDVIDAEAILPGLTITAGEVFVLPGLEK